MSTGSPPSPPTEWSTLPYWGGLHCASSVQIGNSTSPPLDVANQPHCPSGGYAVQYTRNSIPMVEKGREEAWCQSIRSVDEAAFSQKCDAKDEQGASSRMRLFCPVACEEAGRSLASIADAIVAPQQDPPPPPPLAPPTTLPTERVTARKEGGRSRPS
jgi:hypothetical protein